MAPTTVAELAHEIEDMELDSCSDASDESEVSVGRNEHIIFFEFPAVELLPVNAHPYLQTPPELKKRRKPSTTSFHDDLRTDFFAVIDKNKRKFDIDGFGRSDVVQNLLNAVKNAMIYSGPSCLKMVSYARVAGDMDIRHRFQLRTFGTRPATFPAVPNTVQEFELNNTDFVGLLANKAGWSWTNVLQELVTRRSERAYFEVERQLRFRHVDQRSVAGQFPLDSKWDSQPHSTTEELFQARLKPVSAEDSVALYEAGDRDVNLRLPCGHRIYVRKIKILALNEEGCLTYQCPTCSSRVMWRADDLELRFTYDRDTADRFALMHATWKPLDTPTIWHLPRYFHTRTLLEALDLTLTSFKTPYLICPTALCPTNLFSPETMMIIQHFGTIYGRINMEFHMTPTDLYEALEGLAMGTNRGDGVVLAKVSMPPGWQQFLKAWLTRAVNFMVMRGCRMDGEEHSGMHQHNDAAWWYEATISTAEKERRQMAEIETIMARTRIS